MKAIIIRIAIVLFVRWLKKEKANAFLANILIADSREQLILACERRTTEEEINDIVTDIECETLNNVISDMMAKSGIKL